jgi:HK97 family phage major capsid protein
MPANVKGIEEQITDLALKCQTLVNDTTRPWNAADGDEGRKVTIERMEADIKSLTEQHEKYTASETTRKKFEAIAEAEQGLAGGELDDRIDKAYAKGKSIGEQFTDSAQFKSIQGARGQQFSSGGVEVKAGEIFGETAFTVGSLTSASGAAGSLVPEYLRTPVMKLFQRLTVADLIPTGTMSGSSLIYPLESTVTNNAAATAEGGLKPLSVLAITNVTELFKKISTRIKISDETLQDIPAVQSYINARLTLFILLAEEAQLLKGSGSGSNMTGIQVRSGLQTAVVVPATGAPASGLPSVQQKLEAIYQQITNIRVNAFVDPDAMVMDPVSWQQLRIGKDANGQYYGGGPFTGAYGNTQMAQDNSVLSAGGQDVWQLRTVVTTAQTAGTALVGAFALCSQRFIRQGVTVEATNSNEDDFNYNLVSLRAELRELLAVYRPGGFGLVTGLNNAAG